MTQQPAGRRATVACPACGRLNRVDLARFEQRPRCGACERPLPLDRPLVVTDATLDRVVRDAEVPVLVDFYADWCGPCKVMAPLLEDAARGRAGQLLVAKLDVDRNPQMAARFSIQGIPTLVIFRDGREVGREVGALPRPRLEALIARGAAAG